MVLAPGTTLQDRYLITRQLGQGGMGAVYEAADQRLRSKVAIKETFASTDDLRRAFEREAQLLANLRHPALPRVTDHFAEGSGHFLVMEYVNGEDLERHLERRAVPFPVEQVVAWADRLLDALEYLHTRRPAVLHRDIKPANIKVTEEGELYLLDFGLAKGSAGDMTVAHTSRSVYGYSAAYAPPEQVQGLGTDPRSDLYALGATLYHLLTKVAPPNSFARAYAVSLGKPDPLTPAERLTPGVSPGVSAVLGQAMALDIDHRPASAAVLRRMFANARQQDEPPQRLSRGPMLRPPQPPAPGFNLPPQPPPPAPPAPQRPYHISTPKPAPPAPPWRSGAPHTPASSEYPSAGYGVAPPPPVPPAGISTRVYVLALVLSLITAFFPPGAIILSAVYGYRWPAKGWKWGLWLSVVPSLVWLVIIGSSPNSAFSAWLVFTFSFFFVSAVTAAIAAYISRERRAARAHP